MTDPNIEALVAGARAYERLHVPALFKQWCPRVLNAAGVEPGDWVLDVACGTGVLAREALIRVGPMGRVAGVDSGRGMLVVAREIAPDIEWQEAAAEHLPYPDHLFDVVVCQFGLMFFSDRLQALREMIRVLKPGGRLAVAVWDRLENSEAYPIEVELLERVVGHEAANALRAPFALGDKNYLMALFKNSGAQSLNLITENGIAHYPSIKAMVEADLRGWLPIMGVFLTDEQVSGILAAAEIELVDYVTANAGIMFSSPAHIVTGAKP